MRRVGVLMGFAESDPIAQSRLVAFRDALAKLGWTEGSNLRIELRWGADDPDRMRTFAKDLVDLRPDTILAHSLLGTAHVFSQLLGPRHELRGNVGQKLDRFVHY